MSMPAAKPAAQDISPASWKAQSPKPSRVAVMVEWSRKKLEFKDHNDREVAGQYDEKVLEAFQKFDADGSGSISRDELGEERGPGGAS